VQKASGKKNVAAWVLAVGLLFACWGMMSSALSGAAGGAAAVTPAPECQQYLATLDLYIAGNRRWKAADKQGLYQDQTWAERRAIGEAIVSTKPAGCQL
jgi:hypothetical protein